MADPVAGERRSPTAPVRLGLAAAISVLLAVSVPELWHRALWLDEVYTAAAVEHPGVSLSRTRGTMPLCYVTMWLWGQVSIAPWLLRPPSLGTSVVVLWATQAFVGVASETFPTQIRVALYERRLRCPGTGTTSRLPATGRGSWEIPW